MDVFSYMVYVCWLPLVGWFGLFFWFYRVSYPLHFRRLIKKGVKWAYITESFSKNHGKKGRTELLNVLFSVLVSGASSVVAAWLVSLCGVNLLWGLLSFVVFMLLSLFLYHIAVKKVSDIFEAAYFLVYRRVRYAADIKGNFLDETDLRNRTLWSYNSRLRRADEHHRLWKYVNAMARSKKIPPDIYAETMYG